MVQTRGGDRQLGGGLVSPRSRTSCTFVLMRARGYFARMATLWTLGCDAADPDGITAKSKNRMHIDVRVAGEPPWT